MLKRIIALFLVALLAMPAALAAGSVGADTPVDSSDTNKMHNIRLAAQALDGVRVESGETFSFNDTVGPRTSGRGYRTAVNGRGAKVTGGGVAQVATTLYLALLELGSDVRIDPVRTYGSRFVDDYVDDPDLAIITDYDSDIDLSFYNRGDALSIDMWVDEDDLRCLITTGKVTDFSFLDEEDDEDEFAYAYEDEDEDDLPGILLPAFYVEPEGDDEEDNDYGYAYEDEDDGDYSFFDDDEGEDEDDYGYVDTFRASSSHSARNLLGESELNYGGDADVLHNITLAADCIDDTLLERGDSFSFNDVVGPRTREYGYRSAVNGRGVRVVGGGVAQVASALWLAIKDADEFTVVEKSTYGEKYNQHYVKNASDAIVTDYSSGRDFCFKYTGSDIVTIHTWVSDGRLHCEIYED